MPHGVTLAECEEHGTTYRVECAFCRDAMAYNSGQLKELLGELGACVHASPKQFEAHPLGDDFNWCSDCGAYRTRTVVWWDWVLPDKFPHIATNRIESSG